MVRQPGTCPLSLRKRVRGRPVSSVASQALRTWQMHTAPFLATSERMLRQRHRQRIEHGRRIPMAAARLVRRLHVGHNAQNTGPLAAALLRTFSLVSCSLDTCFDDMFLPIGHFGATVPAFIYSIEVSTYYFLLILLTVEVSRTLYYVVVTVLWLPFSAVVYLHALSEPSRRVETELDAGIFAERSSPVRAYPRLPRHGRRRAATPTDGFR